MLLGKIATPISVGSRIVVYSSGQCLCAWYGSHEDTVESGMDGSKATFNGSGSGIVPRYIVSVLMFFLSAMV